MILYTTSDKKASFFSHNKLLFSAQRTADISYKAKIGYYDATVPVPFPLFPAFAPKDSAVSTDSAS